MRGDLPLSTLLSQVLVAFTIELDNEFERLMPHRTSRHGSTPGSQGAPWLVSLVMWSNCMQFVGEKGVRVRELEHLARTRTNLNGMERWGYVVVDRTDGVIRATPQGRRAQEVWRPLFRAIETRWQARLGQQEIEQLRASLSELIRQIDIELPDCLPILGHGLFSKVEDSKRPRPAGRRDAIDSRPPLSALLSQVLLAFAIEFENESELSLAIHANVVRVLDEKGARVRDLPFLSGVSKEAIRVALGVLEKKGVAVVEPEEAGSRTKVVRLTAKGLEAQEAYRRRLGIIETHWEERFGAQNVRTFRESLGRLASEPELYPEGWRASVPKPRTLPHFPMVLHRGGFPDGS